MFFLSRDEFFLTLTNCYYIAIISRKPLVVKSTAMGQNFASFLKGFSEDQKALTHKRKKKSKNRNSVSNRHFMFSFYSSQKHKENISKFLNRI